MNNTSNTGKSLWKPGLIFLIVMSLTVGASAQSARGKGRLAGEIMGTDGKPIGGAKISIEFLKGGGTTFDTKSNKKGVWGFLGLGTGQWRLTATAEGYAPFTTDLFIQQLNKNPKMTITLQKLAPTDAPLIEDETTFELLDQGNALFEEGKYTASLAAFQEFLEKNPGAYQVRMNIAYCYRELGEYDKAIEESDSVLEIIPADDPKGNEIRSKALATIGEVYLKQEDFDSAMSYFTRSIEANPDNELIAYNVGSIFFSNQKLDDAVKYFELAAEIKADWPDPPYQLGLVYLNQANYPKAIEYFEKFLTLEQETGRAESVKNILAQLKK
jgi:tetratricopeptide (TPR) repeat protein